MSVLAAVLSSSQDGNDKLVWLHKAMVRTLVVQNRLSAKLFLHHRLVFQIL